MLCASRTRDFMHVKRGLYLYTKVPHEDWSCSIMSYNAQGKQTMPEGRCDMLFNPRTDFHKWPVIYFMSLLVPYRLARGTLISLLVVCLSIRQSVCSSVTLQFSRLFSVLFTDFDLKFGIWIFHNIIQIKFEFCADFYGSYCPLLKFSFPDFSLPPFERWTWNLVYEFFIT